MAAEEDPNAVITEMALSREERDLREDTGHVGVAYGAEAGNLALKVLSVGGLYVGGGIAPRILEKLKDGTFMKAFHGQGPPEPVADQHAGARDPGKPGGADGRGGVC